MTTLDIHQIKNYLPHRYPFLLIDRVISCEPYDSIVALKNVTCNEPYFQGHFPENPIMPGVLIIEAMAQAAALLGVISNPNVMQDGNLYFLVGVDKTRFKKPVEPGDQLKLTVKFVKEKKNIWKFTSTATVDGQLMASAELMTTVKEPDS